MRYRNQIILPGFGMQKQERLSKKKVLVAGAGGLGSEAIRALAAGGVGELVIVDGDTVAESNLQRQWLYCVHDIGKSKAEIAHTVIENQFPVTCSGVTKFLTEENANELIADADLVLDCTDTFAARKIIDITCRNKNIPWIFAALHQTEAQWAFMNHPDEEKRIQYHDLFPENNDSEPGCADIGVFSILPAIAGLHQASLAIRYLSGWKNDLLPGLYHYSVLHQKINFFKTQVAGVHRMITNSEPSESLIQLLHVDPESVYSMVKDPKTDVYFVDIRAEGEDPVINYSEKVFRWDPAEELFQTSPDPHACYILFCGSGKRSASTVRYLKEQYPSLSLFSLEGGIKMEDNHRLINSYLHVHV